MTNPTTITTKGQVTIPAKIRQKLNIEAGDKTIVQKVDEKTKEITLKVISSQNVVDELAGSLHKPGMKYVPLNEIRKEIVETLAKKHQPDQ